MNYIKILFDTLISKINTFWEAVIAIVVVVGLLAFAVFVASKIFIKIFKNVKIKEIKVGNVEIELENSKPKEEQPLEKQTGE